MHVSSRRLLSGFAIRGVCAAVAYLGLVPVIWPLTAAASVDLLDLFVEFFPASSITFTQKFLLPLFFWGGIHMGMVINWGIFQADRTDTEDQPAPKRRLSSAVFKVLVKPLKPFLMLFDWSTVYWVSH